MSQGHRVSPVVVHAVCPSGVMRRSEHQPCREKTPLYMNNSKANQQHLPYTPCPSSFSSKETKHHHPPRMCLHTYTHTHLHEAGVAGVAGVKLDWAREALGC